MLDGIIMMLNGLGSVDSGVETVFNEDTYNGFMKLIESVYGKKAMELVRSTFVHRENGTYACVMDYTATDFEEHIRAV